MTSVLVMILLQWTRPLESNFATNMETFNEVITLLVLYLLMCFSDFVGDPTMRNECGKAFIAIVVFYALVHITFLFWDVFAKLILSCRKCYYRRKHKKHLAKRANRRKMRYELNPQHNLQDIQDNSTRGKPKVCP